MSDVWLVSATFLLSYGLITAYTVTLWMRLRSKRG